MPSPRNMSPLARFIWSRLFPLPFIAVGAAVLYFGARDIHRARESIAWPAAEGQITASSVEHHSDSDNGTTYGAKVTYTFTVDGRQYSGETVAFGDFSSSDRTRAEETVRRYPKEAAVSVRYRPDNPAVCALESGMKAQLLFLPTMGLIFFAGGMCMAVFLPRAMKPALTAEQVQAVYPGQPWMVRADWAAGRIRSSSQAWLLLLMGIAFCAIGGLATASILPHELRARNYMALFVLLFPLVGLWLVGAFFYARSAGQRFGDCSFEMAAIPGALGGTLEGIIRTGRRLLAAQDGIRLTLSCIRSVTSGSSDSRSTHEYILWQSEKVLRSDMPDMAPQAGIIPVFFRLPADQPESSAVSDSADGIHWRLEAKAKVAGPDFHVKFDVPVFNVAIPADADMADPTEKMQIPVEELRRNENSRIQVNESSAASEFYFPAARNIGTAFSMTFVVVLLGTIATALIVFRIPLIFGIVTGLFALLFLLFALPLWVRTDRVTIDRRGVRVETSWLLYGKTRDFAAADVTGFNTKACMTSGTKQYSDIRLATNSGKEITVATAISDKAEADWLVEKMSAALRKR
jgi:hypothetical protein